MTPVYKHKLFRIVGFAISGLISFVSISGLLFRYAEAYGPFWGDIVYTESNIPTQNGNSILAFRQDGDGQLTPLRRSPFPTGGSGLADPTFTPPVLVADNDDNIIVNPKHTRLFAVNSGSNSIAVFNITENGSLSPVPGSPFPSGGVDPESLVLANDFLYVANRNLGPDSPTDDAKGSVPNYTGFRVTPKGRLIPIPGSTKSVPNGSGPTQVLVSQDKKVLFGVEFIGGNLRSFKILPNGGLEESPNSPQQLPQSEYPSGAQPRPLGLQIHPKQPILYVGFPTPAINKVGVYKYDQVTGELTFIKSVPNSGQAPCWLLTNKAGTVLYTANSVDNSVTVYDITDPTTPREIQHIVLNGPGTAAQAIEIALNSNESFLQVITRRNSPDILEGNGLHVLKINQKDGTLIEVDSSPKTIDSVEFSFPKGLVSINPSQEGREGRSQSR